MGNKFPEDFYGGTHPCIGLVFATFLAQVVVKDFGCSEKEIHDLQLRILTAVQSWLKFNYPQKFHEQDCWETGFAVNADYWNKVINGTDDVVDTLTFLRHLSESNLGSLFDEFGEARIYLALLILALEHAVEIDESTGNLLRVRYSLMAHKCVTELVLADNGPFIFSANHKYEIELLKSAAFALADDAESNAQSKSQRAAAHAKNVKIAEVKQFAIDLYNRGKFPSMSECARQIASQVQEYNEKQCGKVIHTTNYPRSIAKWLSDAQKDRKLKN